VKWLCLLCFVLQLGCQQSYQGDFLQIKMIAPQQAVLLIVQKGKTVSYGGGLDAVGEKTSWQGEMDAEQQEKYQTLLHDTRWQTVVPASDNNRGTGYYDVELLTSTLDTKFKLALDNKSATSLYHFLLQDVSQERLEKHLRSLPRPDIDVIIDRKLKNK
jgi:hypothetical protein